MMNLDKKHVLQKKSLGKVLRKKNSLAKNGQSQNTIEPEWPMKDSNTSSTKKRKIKKVETSRLP
jgi:hypothetical protein